MAHVTGGCGFLFGGAKILRSLKFAAEENRLSDPAGETPDHGIERPDRVELRGSESATGAEHKAWQSSGASLVHAVKGSGEAAFACDEVRSAFEELRRQTCRRGSRLAGERTSHVKSAGRVMAGDNFDRSNRLRAGLLCRIERIFRTGGPRFDLRHIKVAREAVLLLYIREF